MQGRKSRRVSGTGDRWLLRQVRGLRPDGNPLRRRIDKVETCLLGGLFVASAVAMPFAAHIASHAAYENALRAQHEQRLTRDHVEAVLSSTATGPVSGYTTSALVPAMATWKSASGAAKSGWVLADAGSPKGTEVLVWTDTQGDLTGPPLGAAQIASQADAATIGAVAAVVVMSIGAGGILHFVLHRRRLAAWEKDWVVTARAWNRQSWLSPLPPGAARVRRTVRTGWPTGPVVRPAGRRLSRPPSPALGAG
jgi:hypothetical protein